MVIVDIIEISDIIITFSQASLDKVKEKKQNNPQEFAYANDTPVRQHSAVEIEGVNVQQPQITNTLVASKQIHKEIFKDTTVTKPTLNSPDVYNTPEIDRSVAGGENKKLRGFFRKTTRILVRSTAESDNKLLIGGVAINVR